MKSYNKDSETSRLEIVACLHDLEEAAEVVRKCDHSVFLDDVEHHCVGGFLPAINFIDGRLFDAAKECECLTAWKLAATEFLRACTDGNKNYRDEKANGVRCDDFRDEREGQDVPPPPELFEKMHQFGLQVPADIIEAARIEGER